MFFANKRGEQIGDGFTWLAGGFFISLVLGLFLFFVFALVGAGSVMDFFEDDEVVSIEGVDLEAHDDFLKLLGKRIVVNGEDIKVIDGIKEGFSGGKFVEEGKEELIGLISGELGELCGYELEVDGGYFDEDGFHRRLLVDVDPVSQISDRELQRISNKKGKFLLEPYRIEHRNIIDGNVVVFKFVKFMECENV
jgi:hypothetical protein